MRDGYIPGHTRTVRLWDAPLTLSTVPVALESISHLQALAALSLTLDDFATADTIHRIASVFPRPRFLQVDTQPTRTAPSSASMSAMSPFCNALHASRTSTPGSHLISSSAIDAQDGPQGRAAQ
ncbi:hypothetical protein B0H14DRAFT_3504452 [Mycena olivaceomarginata]|nr:hypothetical protein B0H14DRAFT_3504452 [Mycena olivaceomarginata]